MKRSNPRGRWPLVATAIALTVLMTAGTATAASGDWSWNWYNTPTPTPDDEVKQASIDVKPGSYPNSINLKSRGKVPVAVLSTYGFDARDIKRSTVEFADADALPIGGSPQDVDGDGIKDMVLHFNTQDLDLEPGDEEAHLTARTHSGTRVEGDDSVRILMPGKGKHPPGQGDHEDCGECHEYGPTPTATPTDTPPAYPTPTMTPYPTDTPTPYPTPTPTTTPTDTPPTYPTPTPTTTPTDTPPTYPTPTPTMTPTATPTETPDKHYCQGCHDGEPHYERPISTCEGCHPDHFGDDDEYEHDEYDDDEYEEEEYEDEEYEDDDEYDDGWADIDGAPGKGKGKERNPLESWVRVTW